MSPWMDFGLPAQLARKLSTSGFANWLTPSAPSSDALTEPTLHSTKRDVSGHAGSKTRHRVFVCHLELNS